jgi:hypothetical protein
VSEKEGKNGRDDDVYFCEYFKKPSIYIFLFGYFIGIIILFSFFSFPQWVGFIAILGGGVLWTHLFWNKFVYAKFKRRDQSADSDSDGG